MLEDLQRQASISEKSKFVGLTQKVLDALQVGASTAQELSQHRCESVWPHINPTL